MKMNTCFDLPVYWSWSCTRDTTPSILNNRVHHRSKFEDGFIWKRF
jgi:hypothetical protein